jgi:hypothetical protein
MHTVHFRTLRQRVSERISNSVEENGDHIYSASAGVGPYRQRGRLSVMVSTCRAFLANDAISSSGNASGNESQWTRQRPWSMLPFELRRQTALDRFGDNNGQTFIWRHARAHHLHRLCPPQLHFVNPGNDLRTREGYLPILFFQSLDHFKQAHALIQEESDQVPLRDVPFLRHLPT